MPLPPPPPRMPSAPLAPPPPPAAGPGSHSNKADRSALLSQIRGGAKLKKAVTNDRSAPIVQKAGTKTHSPGGPMGLGGLMSQGMPKLRPPGSRAGDRNATQQPSFAHNAVNKTSNTAQPTFSVSEIQRNKQGRVAANMFDKKEGLERNVPLNGTAEKPLPPSSKLKPGFMPNSNETTTKPTPPSSKLKPALAPNSSPGISFQKNTFQDMIQTKNPSSPSAAPPRQFSPVANVGAKEQCPTPTFPRSWPPKQVQNASDRNKPLPPSRISTAVSNTKTSISPSSTANTYVTKGIGLPKPFPPVTRNHTFSANNVADYKGMSTLPVNSAVSPVRNNSVPDNLDQLTRPSSHRPPPPPIPSIKLNQSPSLHHSSKFQQDNVSPAAQLSFIRSSEPPPLPKSAPPPLPYRSPQTLPRRAGRVQTGPVPPTRSFSKQNNQVDTREFESRFKEMFRDIREFPFPSYKITPQKFYMSQAYTEENGVMSFNQQTSGRLLLGKAAEC